MNQRQAVKSAWRFFVRNRDLCLDICEIKLIYINKSID